MKVLILRPSANPERVLLAGKVYDLPSDVASDLIEVGAAQTIREKDIKTHHTPPSTERDD